MDWYTVFWKQWRIFKKRFWKIFSSSLVNPLLYLIVFGWGLGRNIQVEGGSYMQFVIPGIIAMTTMNTSYNAVANPLNISRIYYKTYEEYIIAPISSFSVVLGEVLAGSGRGMFAGLIVLLLSFLFGVNFQISPLLILIMFVNSFLFASLGVVAAMVIDSHEDMAMFSSFVIVPMAFLSNTFFSLQNVPEAVSYLIQIMPLTHTAKSLRAISLGMPVPWVSILILPVIAVILFIVAVRITLRVE